MRKTLKKLKRIDLVDMIYELRKDNLALETKCKELKIQLDETKSALDASIGSVEIEEMYDMLKSLCAAMRIKGTGEDR